MFVVCWLYTNVRDFKSWMIKNDQGFEIAHLKKTDRDLEMLTAIIKTERNQQRPNSNGLMIFVFILIKSSLLDKRVLLWYFFYQMVYLVKISKLINITTNKRRLNRVDPTGGKFLTYNFWSYASSIESAPTLSSKYVGWSYRNDPNLGSLKPLD